MKRILTVLAAAAACGNGGNHGTTDGGGSGGPHDAAIDAPACIPFQPATCAPTSPPTTPATGSATCDPVAQTGCTTGEKCTWIVDDGSGDGHVGCAPVGAVAAECPCSIGSAGPTGYDDCAASAYCIAGQCRAICDPNTGSASCDTRHACSLYAGVFDVGGDLTAGVCDRRCDPLAENDFLGSGSKYMCACGAAQGCYGFPSATAGQPTAFTCSAEINPSLVNRSECTAADGCATDAVSPYLNGCAQGYEPLMLESTASTTVICVALCSPGNTYQGNPGTQYPDGKAPHQCNTTDARGTFEPATVTTNGDHCAYSWLFEVDDAGALVRSPTSDTVGFCFDHTQYEYDSNGDGTPDTVIPPCGTLPLTAAGSAATAAEFGCVDSITANQPVRPRIDARWPRRVR